MCLDWAHGCCLTMHWRAKTGTAIEIAGDSTKTVFEREVLPIMQQQEALWPADVQTYEAFELYAGLVQSRAFHMLSENWLTGLAQEGLPRLLQPTVSVNAPPDFGVFYSPCSLIHCELICCTAGVHNDLLLHWQAVSWHCEARQAEWQTVVMPPRLHAAV